MEWHKKTNCDDASSEDASETASDSSVETNTDGSETPPEGG